MTAPALLNFSRIAIALAATAEHVAMFAAQTLARREGPHLSF